MIYQMTYSSKRAAGVSKLCLSDIIASCARNNAGLDITGVLLSEGDAFLQVIEGPKEAVKFLYRKIARDDRHMEFKLIACRDIYRRSFPGWSMAVREVDTVFRDDCCFELTHAAVMMGPMIGADDVIRSLVTDFLSRNRPRQAGLVEMFGSGQRSYALPV